MLLIRIKLIILEVMLYNKLANYYDEAFKDLSVMTPRQDDDLYVSAKHLYVILLNDRSEVDRNNFIKFLHDKKIGANLHYYPVYKFDHFSNGVSYFPCNEQYFRTAVTIPLSTKLTRENQNYIIEKIKKYLD